MKSKFENIWNELSEIGEISTIKDCSFDDSSQACLIDSPKQAINFDKVSETLIKKKLNLKLKPKSVDCIYFDERDFRSTEVVLVRKGNTPVASNQKSNNHLKKLADSSCPPRLKFLQMAYRIKISSMYQDEYSKRIGKVE